MYILRNFSPVFTSTLDAYPFSRYLLNCAIDASFATEPDVNLSGAPVKNSTANTTRTIAYTQFILNLGILGCSVLLLFFLF